MAESIEQKNEKPIILDGKTISQQQLEEARENKATRIVEKKDGTHVTLTHLRG
jgi:hypothetical protein